MKKIAFAAILLAIAACGRSDPAPAQSPAPQAASEPAPEPTPEPAAGAQMEPIGEAVSLDEMRDRSLAEIDKAECARKGGEVRQEGMLGLYRCVLPYKDAGTVCRSSDDCEGKCLASDGLAVGAAAEGTCQPTDSPFGCYAEIEDGKVAAAICVD